jgi:WD40 repeat protein
MFSKVVGIWANAEGTLSFPFAAHADVVLCISFLQKAGMVVISTASSKNTIRSTVDVFHILRLVLEVTIGALDDTKGSKVRGITSFGKLNESNLKIAVGRDFLLGTTHYR